MIDKGITNRGPKRRDAAALQVLSDIVIPAGTILRQDPGKAGEFSCGADFGTFSVTVKPGESPAAKFKRVVA